MSDGGVPRRLRAAIRGMRSVVIAYSGGVDSALVAAIAQQELGDRALAVTGVSASLAEGELEAATALATRIGVAHTIIHTNEFEDESYRANPANRCFFCKQELFGSLVELARARGYDAVADGANADDGVAALDARPGRAAAAAFGVCSPLAEAGITKTEVRALARRLRLPVWDKPATPCLSSRIPYGTRVEYEALRRVDLAERYLRARGFPIVRVRHYDETARVEVPLADVPRLCEQRTVLEHELTAVGYTRMEIDDRGYRTGSLNERA